MTAKCAPFRTAEDYRDHLPCDACEPDKTLRRKDLDPQVVGYHVTHPEKIAILFPTPRDAWTAYEAAERARALWNLPKEAVTGKGVRGQPQPPENVSSAEIEGTAIGVPTVFGEISVRIITPRAPRLYYASKTEHADRWRALRAVGVPIISTWIDEAGAGETIDFTDLWVRCVQEAATASALVLYIEPGEVLKGAFVEVGAALSHGVPVFVVGEPPGSWVAHPLVVRCKTLVEAMKRAEAEGKKGRGCIK